MAGTHRKRFAAWRRERPFWGGAIMTLAGLLIGYIPFNLARSVGLVPSTFAYAGFIFSVFVILCGVFSIIQPDLRLFFGTAGIILAILSIFGALGGFGIGTLLGILGGSLIIAWEPPTEDVEDESDDERPSRLSRLDPRPLVTRFRSSSERSR